MATPNASKRTWLPDERRRRRLWFRAYAHGTLPIPPPQRRGAGRGTEYYNSTVVHTDPKAFWDKERYEGMLSLFAHEYFHTWNVKRFRPAPIARYDYEKPTIVDLLWAAEGLAGYYDLLLL